MALNRFSEDQLDRSERSAKCACAHVVFRLTYIFSRIENNPTIFEITDSRSEFKERKDDDDETICMIRLGRKVAFKMDLAICELASSSLPAIFFIFALFFCFLVHFTSDYQIQFFQEIRNKKCSATRNR